jgi:hypothetical protein
MNTPKDPSPFIVTKPVRFVRFVVFFSLVFFLHTESSPEVSWDLALHRKRPVPLDTKLIRLRVLLRCRHLRSGAC